MSGRPFSRAVRVGAAIAGDALVAVRPGGEADAPWSCPLAPPGEGEVLSPDLEDALRRLRAALVGAASGRCALHVALLPPLVHFRRVMLPGLGLADARRVLLREPSRHLPLSPAAAPLELEVAGEGWRHRSPFTLAAAPGALVEAVHGAARRAGWTVERIVPAEAAWAAAASAILPKADRNGGTIVVTLDDRVEILRLRDGAVTEVRRFPSRAPGLASLAASLVAAPLSPAAAGAARPAIALVGEGVVCDELREALRASAPAVRVTRTPPGVSPAALAARFAADAAGPVLRSASDRAELERRSARRRALHVAAAAALLVAGALLESWSVSRELSRVAAERARVRAAVSAALATRDTLARAAGRLAALRAASEDGPRMSRLVLSLAAALPGDGFIVSLRADADTLWIEGSASHAAPVFDALARVPAIRALRPAGPIRQDVAEDGATTEHYSLSALLGRTP